MNTRELMFATQILFREMLAEQDVVSSDIPLVTIEQFHAFLQTYELPVTDTFEVPRESLEFVINAARQRPIMFAGMAARFWPKLASRVGGNGLEICQLAIQLDCYLGATRQNPSELVKLPMTVHGHECGNSAEMLAMAQILFAGTIQGLTTVGFDLVRQRKLDEWQQAIADTVHKLGFGGFGFPSLR